MGSPVAGYLSTVLWGAVALVSIVNFSLSKKPQLYPNAIRRGGFCPAVGYSKYYR